MFNIKVIKKYKKKVLIGIVLLLLLAISVTTGTYAYLGMNADTRSNIKGKVGSPGLDIRVTLIKGTYNPDFIPQYEYGDNDALQTAVSNECIDENGNTVCQVYEIEAINTGTITLDINAYINFEHINTLPNLKWKMMDGASTIGNTYSANSASTSSVKMNSTPIKIRKKQSKLMYMVVWINETGEHQTDSGTFNGTITLERTVVQKPQSFSEGSWETIATAVKSGDYPYQVGDTKTITLASHTNDCASSTGSGATYQCVSQVEPEKTVTLRVANTSECTNGETSETACGFVVEFVDIIETHNMNPANATNPYGTNKGGWPVTAMRNYLNSTILNALPSDLQNVISNTTVISGHGATSGETNFTSTDKLYLLSTKEVWGKSGTSNVINYDTAESETRQLDYYANNGVSTSNYAGAIKQYNGSNDYWYLRSASSNTNSTFFIVSTHGDWGINNAYLTHGLSPAFRLGT